MWATSPHADQPLREELIDALTVLADASSDLGGLVNALAAVDAAMAAVVASEADWAGAHALREAEGRAAADRAEQLAAEHTALAADPGAVAMRAAVEAELRSLPGSDGVEISWDDPALGENLGAVWMGGTTTVMMNASRLADVPAQARDVVRHELAHIYQGRVMASHGLSGEDLAALMAPAFGDNGLEKSADCVALRFSASWVSYTRDCWTPAQEAWVDALIAGRTP